MTGELAAMSIGKGGYRVIAYLSVGLAIAGAVLPLLPSTVFILIAAWAAGRSSPEFEAWLLNHRRFGPVIANWRHRQVVPRSAKVLACAMLCVSWATVYVVGAPAWMLVLLGAFFCALGGYLLSRPSC
ncbi:YbaN family protein [Marinobacter sp. SS21]|nr:YbaN family protein [Marinobacter sp. SS21]